MQQPLNISGSAELIGDFFKYAINSILYQRGIYPAELFVSEKKYNMFLLVSKDDELNTYISTILSQVQEWLILKNVKKLVLIICESASSQVIERWQFDVHLEDKLTLDNQTKPIEKIQSEIQALIRQITASISFLPLIESHCVFDLLVYTGKNMIVPSKWEFSDPRIVQENPENMQLLSFSTPSHKVSTSVMFKIDK